jgi:hypothetical protein
VKWVVLAVLVASVAGVWRWEHERHVALERRLGAVASELAGRPVHVSCQGFFAELVDVSANSGDVRFPDGRPADTAHLKRGPCGALDAFGPGYARRHLDCLLTVDWSRWSLETDFDAPCTRRAQRAVNAITTLTHESMHLRGWTDEATAQCYAIQDDPWTVVQLGGTQAEGAAVASLALAEQGAMPSEYQSGECRAGGGLDLHPDTPSFPAEATAALLPAGLVGPALQR